MGFYIRQALGFFLQIFPCMVLCVLPWGEEAYRFRRKWTLLGFGTAAAVLALAFPLPLFATAGRDSFALFLAANLYMLTSVVLCCAAYFWTIRENAIKKLLAVNLAGVYAAVQFMLVNMAAPFVGAGTPDEVYPPAILGLFLGSTAALFPIAARMMRHTVRCYLRQTEPQLMKREFLWVFFASMAYFALLIFYNTTVDLHYFSGDFWRILSPPFLFAAVVLVAFYWILLREAVRRKEDYERQWHDEIQQLQYRRIVRDMEKTRRMRHDLRHHLGVLYDMAKQGKSGDLQAYLSELLDRTAQNETEWFCENPTVNGLLQNYIGRAREEGVRCVVRAECGDLPVSPVDLTVILGNTLENAVRACAAVPENKWLRASIWVVGGSLAIQVENSCEGVHPARRGWGYRDNEFLPAGAFSSSRAEGGMGLQSITLAAEKYDGDVGFRYSMAAKAFTTRVRLNLHPPGREP